MRPITLRLPEDLIEDLDAEADEAGFSSRSEYIRYLLAHRDTSSPASSIDGEQATSDAGLDEEVLGELSELSDRLGSIEDRVADLENDVSPLQVMEEQDDTPIDTGEEPPSEVPSPEGGTDNEEVKVFPRLKEWLVDNGPDSEPARNILVDAARLLDDRGPLQTGELRDDLYEQYPDAYGSASTLWSATIARWYEDIPGFEKLERGTYGFNREEFRNIV